jgi:16S rRNA (cytidine1402-2'-O)-methyltransferase
MTLYIVSLPIGNLEDITLRAIKTLKKVEVVIAEDTRFSLKLLNHLGIKKRLLSYYKPNEAQKVSRILKILETQDAALITDSGTPLISDPGYILVKEVIKKGIDIVPLPGPTALIPALVTSGLNPESFVFLGFPPRKKSKLVAYLKKMSDLKLIQVFYESPRRIEFFLRTLYAVYGNRKFCLAKEISKKHEKIIRSELKDLEEVLKREIILGEIVVVVEGCRDGEKKDNIPDIDSLEDIFNHFKDVYGISKNKIKQAIMRK